MPETLPTNAVALSGLVRVDIFSSSDIYERELLGSFLVDLDRELVDYRDIPADRLKLILKNLAQASIERPSCGRSPFPPSPRNMPPRPSATRP